MLFTSSITVVLIEKNLSVKQNIFYEMAKVRIEIEREIVTIIKNHEVFPIDEELTIAGQHVFITYGDPIKARVCSEVCYSVLIEYDQTSLRILSIDYE